MDNIRRTFPRNGERILRSLAWALTLTGLSVELAQSSTGSVNGVASDPSGLALSGAAVTLESFDRGEKRTTITNTAGLFEFVLMPPGFSTRDAREVQSVTRFTW